MEERPQTGCWAGMIAPFADKLTGKRMRNTGKNCIIPLALPGFGLPHALHNQTLAPIADKKIAGGG